MTTPYFPRRLERMGQARDERHLKGHVPQGYERQQRESTPDARALQTLPERGVTVILGEPGAGKSTLARHWARTLADTRLTPDWQGKEPHIPLLAQCSRLNLDAGLGLPWSLVRAAMPAVPPEVTRAALDGQLRYTLILDALDELNRDRREDLARSLTTIHAPIVVTCREQVWHAYLERPFRESGLTIHPPYTIAPLTAREQHDYLHQWPEKPDDPWAEDLHRRIQGNAQLRALAGNALLLSMMARLALTRGLELPVTRARFYQLATADLWRRKPHKEGQEALPEHVLDLLGVTRDRYLPALAKHVADTDGPTAPITPAHLEAVADSLNLQQGRWERLMQALLNSGLLTREGTSEEPTYHFLHQTFREYALATALLNPSDRANLPQRLLDVVQRHWDKPDDHQMLALAYAIADQNGVSLLMPTAWLLEQSETLTKEERWARGVSPMRKALHLLGDAGVELQTMLQSLLNSTILHTAGRKIATAWDESTPANILRVLATDEDSDVRRGVAENPNTPVATLQILATDKASFVRRGVAENPNTPVATLQILATDEDSDVRRGVARNPNTHLEDLLS